MPQKYYSNDFYFISVHCVKYRMQITHIAFRVPSDVYPWSLWCNNFISVSRWHNDQFYSTKMSDNTKPRQTRERTDIYMQI